HLQRPADALMHAIDRVVIHHVSVVESKQRTGVGTALLHRALDTARELGVQKVALDTWSFNDGARAFFQRHGFDVFNVRLWRDA
ncbi:MAG: GNAT family N-acetyltransferase, partial [Pseudomonadota bacterium]